MSCDEKVAVDFGVGVQDGTGLRGTWLDARSANRLAFVLTTCLPALEKTVGTQSRLIDLQVKSIHTATETASVAKGLALDEHARAERWKQEAVQERALRLEERAAADGIWRSPVLWYAVGVVTTVGLALGLTYGLEKARTAGAAGGTL